jgi:Tfp pilus assembly protein PilF
MTSAAPPLPPELAAAFRDGCAALRGDDVTRAARLFETVLAGAPGHIPALTNLARCHFTARDFAAAEVRYSQALALAPGDATALLGLATSMHRAGRLSAAVDAYRTALAAAPDDTTVLHNLATALRDQGRLDEALALFRKALALKPDYHACALNYATALFYKEEWGEGWRVFEARLATHKIVAPFSTTSDATGASVAVPHWRSGPQPRSLLVLGEQGLGDNIQFARFLPELVRTGTRVTFVTDRKLFALLGGLGPGIDFVPRHQPLSIKGLTGWVPLMSLPLALGLRPGGLAPRIPYLSAEPERVGRWRERLGHTGVRVGIAWQGNPAGDIDHGRSIPLARFAPLAEIPGVRLISLQKGDGEDQIAQAPFADRIETPGDLDAGPDAFVDTAAVMMGLDLVITCDTAVAHLAGALGRPFWVLLRQAPDWRWLHAGDTSPFYPTARLFRQKTADGWTGVFAEVATALREAIDETEASGPLVRPPGEITVPVATGELMDKITILEIKAERIQDPAKVANVRRELQALLDVRHRHGLQGPPELDQEVARLKALNESLWEVEDAIRYCEAAGDFGERFIALARSVYRLNDRRAEHKKAINLMCGSLYVEEKSYRDWGS